MDTEEARHQMTGQILVAEGDDWADTRPSNGATLERWKYLYVKERATYFIGATHKATWRHGPTKKD